MSSEEKRVKRSITTNEKTSSAGSKKVFDPELECFTKRVRRFESTIHQPGSKQEKLSIETLCEKILIALDHYYSNDESGFYTSCKEFLSRGIDSWKQKIVDRMNTYDYLEMAIAHKPFTDIEIEIIKEWRKNYLLFAIMTFWYSSVQKWHFNSLKEFKKQYDTCRDFVSQISNLMFKPWLHNWEKRMEKNNVSSLGKLYEESSHLIITESSEFKRVYEKVMIPLINRELIGTDINWGYDLNELNTKRCVFDLEREKNLTKTIEALRKFCKEVKLSKKIELLREYRLTLEQEINAQQEIIQMNEGHNRTEVLESDDFISALVYCTIRGRLEELRYSILYMVCLMGEELELLSKLKIKVYFDHLLAVSEFLTVHSLSQEEERELEKLQNLAINRRMKVESSPLIEDNEFKDILIEHKHLMTVKNFTEVEKEEHAKGGSSLEKLSNNLTEC